MSLFFAIYLQHFCILRATLQFQTIEDLMNIQGIGEKTYLRLREYLCL